MPSPCEVGSVRCNDASLEMCVQFQPGQTGWQRLEDCGSAELCVSDPAAHCLARTCDAGSAYCEGATPRVCNAASSGWNDLPACSSASRCSTNAANCPNGAPCCLPAPCTAGETRCNQGEMQRCRPDQSDWDSFDLCETPELCDGGLAGCGAASGACRCQEPTCSVGETRCDGATLQRCNAGRSGWDVIDTCATPQLCELGRELQPLSCNSPTCDAGAFFCTDSGLLQKCRDDRTGFDDVQACEGGQPFCDPNLGRCNPTACDAGDRRCNGAQIEVCLDDRTGFRSDGFPCATSALCNDSDPSNVHCDNPACDAGAVSCFGSAQLSACNDGRTAFVPVGAPCLRPDLCSAERRRCDFCFPGRQECTIDLGSTRVCSTSGNFFGPETVCPLGCNGPSGTCVTCTVGQYRCQGNTITRCNDGRSFASLGRSSDCSGQLQVTCNNGQLFQVDCGSASCNPASASCNECSGTQRRCQGDGFQQCSQGSFGDVQACDDGLTCAGQGVCSCTPLATSCVDGELLTCNLTGTGFLAGLGLDCDTSDTSDTSDNPGRGRGDD
jgi:hypothetical protein